MLSDKLTWTQGRISRNGWDSDDCNYRIIVARNGRYRLVSFIHEDDRTGDFKWWDFDSLEEAKAYAERI